MRAGARRGEADAVRHLLRHEAGARLRPRAPRPRRADRARLGARPRRPRRRSGWRALPRDGADAGRAVPRPLPRRQPPTRPATSRGWPRGCAPRRCAGVPTAAGGRRRPATLTALALSDLLFDSDYNPPIRAGVPAAVRAALDTATPAPLLRLVDAADGLAELPGAARRSRPPATRRCARRRRCRGRAATPFGERAAARPRAGGGARAGARSSRSTYEEARPTRSTSACAGPRRPRRAAGPAAPIPRCRRCPAGRRGPAHAAGGLRARRGGAPGRAARRRAGRRARRGRAATRAAAACARCSRSCAGGPARGACPRVPTRACPPPACRRRRWASWRAGAGVPGRARAHGGRARRHARRPPFSLSPALLAAAGARAARRDASALRAARDRARRACRSVRGVRVSGRLPRRGSARLRISGGRARPAAGCGSRRGGVVRGRLGRPARARAPAGGAAAAGGERCAKRRREDRARFRHRTALSSVRPAAAASVRPPPIWRSTSRLQRSTPR